MTSSASREYVDSFVVEDAALVNARGRAAELGCTPVAPGSGAALRFIAAALDARAVVEVGTGAGVSGLWLLRGMRPDGVLTTVDVEVEHQRAARQTFVEAGIPPSRTRIINGMARDVLPRLTDRGYDIVFCDAQPREYADQLGEALRLLRPGGVVAFDDALWRGRVPDPAARDIDTVALRDLGKLIREHEQLVPVVIPIGEGLLAAVHRPDRPAAVS